MFKKGEPRHPNAGRKKGTPHKKSALVREILENNGINLVEEILVRLPGLSKDEQVKALTQMLPYVYPKLTAVEHSGSVAGATSGVLLTLSEVAELVRANAKSD